MSAVVPASKDVDYNPTCPLHLRITFWTFHFFVLRAAATYIFIQFHE